MHFKIINPNKNINSVLFTEISPNIYEIYISLDFEAKNQYPLFTCHIDEKHIYLPCKDNDDEIYLLLDNLNEKLDLYLLGEKIIEGGIYFFFMKKQKNQFLMEKIICKYEYGADECDAD